MSSDDRARSGPDLTMTSRTGGSGMSMSLLYMCKHRGHRTGGTFRGNLPMYCPACTEKRNDSR